MNRIVDGMMTGCAELYENLHGSTTLMFEAMASQWAVARSWWGVKWSDPYAELVTINGESYEWIHLSEPTFYSGTDTSTMGDTLPAGDTGGSWWSTFASSFVHGVGHARQPGQSFGGCVANNISQTTGGLIPNSTTGAVATALAGAAGTALTFLKTQGSTPNVQVPLSAQVAFAVGMTARILSGGLVSLGGAYTVGVATAYAIAGVGGAGVGLILGSMANCAGTGVGP